MNDTTYAPDGSLLCKACGLCCDGTMYDHALLIDEDDEARLALLGLSISNMSEGRRGMKLPCICFDQFCTIYNQDSPYPYQGRANVCATYKCKLLKMYLAGNITEQQAINVVQEAVRHATQVRQNFIASADNSEKKNKSLFLLYKQAKGFHCNAAETKLVQVFVDYMALQFRLDKYFRYEKGKSISMSDAG